MILSRAPVRFSLGGGGTDLPSYSNRHGGFVVGAAVDKFIFIAANRRFYDSIRLMYSKTETTDDIDAVEHRIFRESLRLMDITHGIELVSIGEVPPNSGLGSSSAFTVALLNALHAYRREFVPSEQLAHEACHIEMNILQEPIGRQDQYISAYGGITALTFEPGGAVGVERVPVKAEVLEELEHNLLVFYSGVERAASEILTQETKTIEENQDRAVERLHRIKALGHETKRILLTGDLDEYGELLNEHWMHKRRLAEKMTSPSIDEHYEAARRAGALGGKLMGAGGGGFFMLYARPQDRRRVRDVMLSRGLRPLRFRFEQSGAAIIANHHTGY